MIDFSFKRVQIAVIGSSGVIDSKLFSLAYEVGQEIAKRGAVLICGGRDGIMEAVSKGVKDGAGISVGIVPSYTGKDANPYLTITIATGIGFARNTLVVASSDAVIVIGGRAGTLSELAIASLLNKPLIALIKGGGVAKIAEKLVEEGIINRIYEAESPKEAVEKAIDMVTKKEKKQNKNKTYTKKK